MKASTALFDLIKSLEGAEKGYFKKHSSIKSADDKNYLLLFDSIARQKEYDEKELRGQFKNHAFARQFPVAKTYLYDRILKALDSYHNSDNEEIRSSLHDAEVLYEKGLYKQSLRSVKKAKEKALRHDMHYFLPEVFHWELNLAKEQYDLKWTEKIMKESDQHLVLLRNILAYRQLSLTVGILAEQSRKKKSADLMRKIQNVMGQPALKNERSALTFTSKIYFHNAHVSYCFAAGIYSKAKIPLEKIISLCEQNLDKTKNNFHFYITCVNNLLEIYFEENAYEEAMGRLEKFKQTLSSIKNHSSKAFQFYVHDSCLMRYLIRTGQFDKATGLLPAILHEYDHYKSELNEMEKIILSCYVSLIRFGGGDYKKCIQTLNGIRNERDLGIRPDIDRFLRLFYIIAHYEAGHSDLLPYLIQSAYRSLRKQDLTSRLEESLVLFFKNEMVKSDSPQKLTEAFRQLRSKLLLISKDKNEKNAFDFFDYTSWAESKVEKKSFAEAVAEKAKKGE